MLRAVPSMRIRKPLFAFGLFLFGLGIALSGIETTGTIYVINGTTYYPNFFYAVVSFLVAAILLAVSLKE
jgi:uncharacterized membrane protein YedE/YeeE